jgi:hypothetical protein
VEFGVLATSLLVVSASLLCGSPVCFFATHFFTTPGFGLGL